jgi:AcrR family transcriptional regulator
MIKNKASSGEAKRRQIVDAALAVLKKDGFAGATSRARARAAGVKHPRYVNHFGTLDGLLLAALDRTSAERLARYGQAVEEARTIDELAAVAARVYEEDRDSGHMTVVSQMVAGSVARPELAPEILARTEPWIDLCEEALRKAFARLPAPEGVPLRDLAYAVVTFYLGLNLLTHLDEDRAQTDRLVAQLQALTPLVAGFEQRREAG